MLEPFPYNKPQNMKQTIGATSDVWTRTKIRAFLYRHQTQNTRRIPATVAWRGIGWRITIWFHEAITMVQRLH